MSVAKTQEFLRRVFFENTYYKLFSMVLVAVLYIWVLGDRDSELTVFAPLRLAVPEGMVMMNQPTDQVRLTISGRWSGLQRFSEENDIPPVLAELEPESGETTVRLTPSMVRLPPGLRVRTIQPSLLRVELEERQTHTVPVRARTVGSTPQGYRVGPLEIDPEKVQISGPRSVIEDIRVVPTSPIDVTGKEQTFTEEVTLRHDSPLLRDELDGPVRVKVPVEAVKAERTLEDLPVRAVNTTMRTQISPPTVDVTVRGPRELIRQIEPRSVLVTIDLSQEEERGPGTFQKQPQVRNLPRGADLVRIYPTDFRVETSRREPPTPEQ